LRDAESTTRHLAKELAEIEEEILDEQADDSAYARSTSRVSETRDQVAKLEERILGEETVQSQLAGLSGGDLLDKRKALLEQRPEYARVKNEFNAAAGELAKIRNDLFQRDPDWKQASVALAEARREEREAETKTRSSASTRVSAGSTAKDAAEAAAAARAAIARSEAIIRAAERDDDKKRSTKNPPPKKKKK
jgi:hypothetical protein